MWKVNLEPQIEFRTVFSILLLSRTVMAGTHSPQILLTPISVRLLRTVMSNRMEVRMFTLRHQPRRVPWEYATVSRFPFFFPQGATP
jgi:hypothetical protein